jgi:hypothetical protein
MSKTSGWWWRVVGGVMVGLVLAQLTSRALATSCTLVDRLEVYRLELESVEGLDGQDVATEASRWSEHGEFAVGFKINEYTFEAYDGKQLLIDRDPLEGLDRDAEVSR